MCGRYTLLETDEIFDRFGIAEDTEQIKKHLKPRYNIAPGQNNPVVTKNSPNKLSEMKWGLIPVWAKDTKIGNKMINARSEGLLEKPYFKRLLGSKRCLIPASGFFEWSKKSKEKEPFYFHLKHQKLFAFAGLYDRYEDLDGNEIYSYTIITTKPNSILKKVHDRMPVIIETKNEEKWLNQDEKDLDFLVSLLDPFASKEMDFYEVSKEVNSPSHILETTIKPVVK